MRIFKIMKCNAAESGIAWEHKLWIYFFAFPLFALYYFSIFHPRWNVLNVLYILGNTIVGKKKIKINTSRAYTQANQWQKQRWNPQVYNRPDGQTSKGNRGETPRYAKGLLCLQSLEGQTLTFQCRIWMGMPMLRSMDGWELVDGWRRGECLSSDVWMDER